MPKCTIRGCVNSTTYQNTVQIYCEKHLARLRRHGYTELKRDHGLEKLPHEFIDNFIKRNCRWKFDEEIAEILQQKGYKEASVWNVKYRRRRLGIKKYLYGEVKKHKAWIRLQAIKQYGNQCELCEFKLVVDTHHIIPKYDGGPHEVSNLMVVCPNCHALITRKKIKISGRNEIPSLKKKFRKSLKSLYNFTSR